MRLRPHRLWALILAVVLLATTGDLVVPVIAPVLTQPASATTQTFTTTTAGCSGTPVACPFTVPAGVTSMSVIVNGASGGAGQTATGGISSGAGGAAGLGASVTGAIPVSGNQALTIILGGSGTAGSGGTGQSGGSGFNGNGGGQGGNGGGSSTGGGGGGGGGASAIYPTGTPGSPLVVAGGGGGGGGGGSASLGLVGGVSTGGMGGNANQSGTTGTPFTSGLIATVGTCCPTGGPGGAGGNVAAGTSGTTSSGGGGGGGGGFNAGGSGGGAGGLPSGILPSGGAGGAGGGGGRSWLNGAPFPASGNPPSAPTGNGTVTITFFVDTNTTVSSNTNPSIVGQSVNFTCTVTSAGAGTPTGTVTLQSPLGTPIGGSGGTASLSGGTATLTASFNSAGPNSVFCVYSPSTTPTQVFGPSTSPAITQTVNLPPTATTLSQGNPNPSVVGQPVSFTCDVSPNTATGTVTLQSPLGTVISGAPVTPPVTLANGSAEFTAAFSSTGPHSVFCVYGGSAAFEGSTSAAVTQTVNPFSPSLHLSASMSPVSVTGAGTANDITYFITLTNTGTVPIGITPTSVTATRVAGQPATAVSITCPTITLAPNDTTECSGVYTPSTADITGPPTPTGEITQVFTASGTQTVVSTQPATVTSNTFAVAVDVRPPQGSSAIVVNTCNTIGTPPPPCP